MQQKSIPIYYIYLYIYIHHMCMCVCDDHKSVILVSRIFRIIVFYLNTSYCISF